MQDPDEAHKGVAGGLPARDFENLSAAELDLLGDAQPFRDKPQPIGGSRKGIPNKRNAQMRELYLKSGLPHPLLWQGQLLRRGIDGLAGDLKCTAIEAAELLRKVAADALPYIEGKMPTRVQVDGANLLPVVVFGDAGQARERIAEARAEGSLAIDDDIEQAIEQYQRLSESERERSHEDGSHDEAKPLDDNDNPPPRS